jgi:aryl-alcohol dehydrogenase-like predicted oxidoreductase
MELRTCGRSDLSLPVLGVGVWSFGGGSYWGPQDDKDADAVVSAAFERGCAFFDTAEAYNDGRSEETLGRVLKGRRSKAVILSKISPDHCAGTGVREHCKASLARLGTDYLDVYLLHWPLGATLGGHAGAVPAGPTLPEVLAALDSLRREGLVRHVGISNFGARQLDEAAACGVPLACNEVAYSLLTRAIEDEVVPACTRASIGVLGYMPLMQGLLSGRYHSADELPPMRARTRHFRGDRPGSRHGEPGREVETFAALDAVRGIASKEGVTMEAAALAWAVARPAITAAITGARTAAQLHANADAVERGLGAETVAALDRATDGLKAALGPSIDIFENAARPRSW